LARLARSGKIAVLQGRAQFHENRFTVQPDETITIGDNRRHASLGGGGESRISAPLNLEKSGFRESSNRRRSCALRGTRASANTSGPNLESGLGR
jgi:hypothetical protein